MAGISSSLGSLIGSIPPIFTGFSVFDNVLQVIA
jgi:hypothetical protein